MHRLADGLAGDVPHRHLDAGEHAEQRGIRAPAVARGVDVAPGRLDVERLAADHVARDDVLDHPATSVRRDGRDVDLAEALDARVGLELEEDEVAAAVAGRRVADDERADAGDLHSGFTVRRGALLNVSTTSTIARIGTISVHALATMPRSAPAVTSFDRDERAPEDAVEHEQAAAPQRGQPERQAARVVQVRDELGAAEREIDTADEASQDADPPRRSLACHARTLRGGAAERAPRERRDAARPVLGLARRRPGSARTRSRSAS